MPLESEWLMICVKGSTMVSAESLISEFGMLSMPGDLFVFKCPIISNTWLGVTLLRNIEVGLGLFKNCLKLVLVLGSLSARFFPIVQKWLFKVSAIDMSSEIFLSPLNIRLIDTLFLVLLGLSIFPKWFHIDFIPFCLSSKSLL